MQQAAYCLQSRCTHDSMGLLHKVKSFVTVKK